jgi:hypothetical protein
MSYSTPSQKIKIKIILLVKIRLRSRMKDEFLTYYLLVYIEKEIANDSTTEIIIN